MYEDFFTRRLASLRAEKHVSAREVSLALGQNASYINRIENKKNFPSMQGFFYICDYFGISPKEFFDTEIETPGQMKEIVEELKHLDYEQLNTVLAVIKGFQGK